MADKLQDALTKGDVIELEEAIAAAQAGLRTLARRNAGRPMTELQDRVLAKARHVLAQHLELCRPYLKPLRRACRQRDERAISEALLWAQGASPQVQLYMYTDLMRAEAARDELRRLRKEAVAILASESCSDIDAFLTRRADLLDDRTILKLVQRREELLRRERPMRSLGRPTESHARSRPRVGGDADVVASVPPRRVAPRLVDQHHDYDEAREPARGAAPRRPFTETTARSPRWPFAADGASPTNDNPAATTNSVVSGPARRLERLEVQQREALCEDELQSRIVLYEAAIEASATTISMTTLARRTDRGGSWQGASGVAPQTASSARKDTMVPDDTTCATPHLPAHAGMPKTPRTSYAAVTRSNVRPQAISATLPSPSPRHETLPTAGYVVEPRAAVAVGPNVTPPRLPLCAVPALRYRTPSVSPIKVGDHGRGDVKDLVSSSNKTSAALEALLMHTGQRASPAPRPSPGASPVTTSEVPTSTTVTSSIDRKRIAARLRVLSQEETIHRQDIEGTEDFDRSVFLLPAAARLQLFLLQTQR